jgi:hypothetical protein
MAIAREEAEWPRVSDPVHEAIGLLLVAIIEATSDGSKERAKAMSIVLEAQRRIVDALRPGPALN